MQAELVETLTAIRDGWALLERASRSRAAYGRFHPSRTHKASSAESILRHCLRQLGFTRRWREGRLTGRQHLRLLEAVRQYGRAWMRHEAECFFEHYGVRDEVRSTELPRSIHADDDRSSRNDSGSRLAMGALNPVDENGAHGLERALSDRILSPLRRWFDRAKQFTREAIHAGVAALKGDVLDADEAAEADRLAGIQDKFLDSFETEFTARPAAAVSDGAPLIPSIKPPLSPAQFAARAELYGNAAWQAAQRVNRTRVFKYPLNVLPETQGKPVDLVAEPPGVKLPYPVAGPPPGKRRKDIRRPTATPKSKPLYERRVLGHPKTEHCHDCPPLAALGWQPFGTLPDIGDSECGPLCLCHFSYTDVLPSPTGKTVSPSPEPAELVAEPPGFEILDYPVAGPPPK